MSERLYTLSEAARVSRGADNKPLAQVSLRAAAQRGYLKARKVNGKWMVSESALRAYLRDRPAWWKPRHS